MATKVYSPNAKHHLECNHQIIFKEKGIYACFPSLTVLDPVTFSTTFYTRIHASHIDPAGGTKTLMTRDGGNTWAETSDPIVDPNWKTAKGFHVTAEADGWIESPESKKNTLVNKGKYVRDVSPGIVACLGGASYRISKDNGRQWQSHKIDIPEYISGLQSLNKRAAELKSQNGVRLVSIYGWRKDEKSNSPVKRPEVFFLRSDDDGATWKCIPLLPDGLRNLEVGLAEPSIIENNNGEIVAMMRTKPYGKGWLWTSISQDDGLTWSKPEKTNIWGYPADLLNLDDGRILCTYGYRRKPMGIRAVVSNDGGHTWNVRKKFVLRDDGFTYSGNLGYPLTVQLPDHRIMTIYYLTTKDGITHIATTHWQLP